MLTACLLKGVIDDLDAKTAEVRDLLYRKLHVTAAAYGMSFCLKTATGVTEASSGGSSDADPARHSNSGLGLPQQTSTQEPGPTASVIACADGQAGVGADVNVPIPSVSETDTRRVLSGPPPVPSYFAAQLPHAQTIPPSAGPPHPPPDVDGFDSLAHSTYPTQVVGPWCRTKKQQLMSMIADADASNLTVVEAQNALSQPSLRQSDWCVPLVMAPKFANAYIRIDPAAQHTQEGSVLAGSWTSSLMLSLAWAHTQPPPIRPIPWL